MDTLALIPISMHGANTWRSVHTYTIPTPVISAAAFWMLMIKGTSCTFAVEGLVLYICTVQTT